KAAAKAGIKLKVETQGANGIINRISAKDVANARCVIFAHDVAIKNKERFAHIEVIDVKTREAIHNPEGLLARTQPGRQVA
ncbi:PTS fructose transporter subunit IIB, partial [Aeromonas hydrophila]